MFAFSGPIIDNIKSWFSDYFDILETNDWTDAFIEAPDFVGTFICQELQVDFNSILNKTSFIPKKCFKYCDEIIKELIIPKSIQVVERGAFENCNNIISAQIESSNVAGAVFRDCHFLQTVIFDEGINKLESCMFFNCPNLKEVYLPNSCENMKYNSFAGIYQSITIYIKNEDLFNVVNSYPPGPRFKIKKW